MIVDWKEQNVQKIKCYTIDLTKTKGSGDVECPKCRIKISPDDETENVYTVLETVTERDCLQTIILQCNRCGAQIHLVGFHFLDETR